MDFWSHVKNSWWLIFLTTWSRYSDVYKVSHSYLKRKRKRTWGSAALRVHRRCAGDEIEVADVILQRRWRQRVDGLSVAPLARLRAGLQTSGHLGRRDHQRPAKVGVEVFKTGPGVLLDKGWKQNFRLKHQKINFRLCNIPSWKAKGVLSARANFKELKTKLARLRAKFFRTSKKRE